MTTSHRWGYTFDGQVAAWFDSSPKKFVSLSSATQQAGNYNPYDTR